MAQTAVEFYHSKIKSIMGNWTPIMIQIFEETFEQAKEMEKQQIINAYVLGDNGYSPDNGTQERMAEQYYNETYNK